MRWTPGSFFCLGAPAWEWIVARDPGYTNGILLFGNGGAQLSLRPGAGQFGITGAALDLCSTPRHPDWRRIFYHIGGGGSARPAEMKEARLDHMLLTRVSGERRRLWPAPWMICHPKGPLQRPGGEGIPSQNTVWRGWGRGTQVVSISLQISGRGVPRTFATSGG